MSKQDGASVRSAADLERKYNFEKRFSEIMGVADDARGLADAAQKTANEAAGKLTAEEIFNILTNNGTVQGIYRGEDGQVYINASYIAGGILDASLINTGILQSADGTLQINLNTGALEGKSPDRNLLFSIQRNSANTGATMLLMSNDQTKAIELDVSDESARIGFSYNGSTKIMMHYLPSVGSSQLQIGNVSADNIAADKIKSKTISWKSNGDGTYTLIGT